MLTTFITTYKRPQLLDKTLKSLSDTDIVEYPVHVVSNSNDPETLEVIKKHKFVTGVNISTPNKGICYAVNIGVEIGKFEGSKYINMLQDDVSIKEKNFISTLLSALKEYNDLMCVSGCDCVFEYTSDVDGFKRVKETRKLGKHNLNIRGHVSGQNILMSTANWKKFFPIGYFYEEGFYGNEACIGNKRGLPNDGRGSEFDWWISVHSPYSAQQKNKKIGTIDLLDHTGKTKSTWCDRGDI